MKIDITGLSPEKKQKIKSIAMLSEQFGSDPSIYKSLVGAIIDIYLGEETNSMDELASLYSITGDEGVKGDLINEYYKGRGVDPAQKQQQEALFSRFSQEFPLDSSDAGQNAYYQSVAKSNPDLLSQYYQGQPESDFKWGWIPAGAGAGALVGAGIGAAGGPIGMGAGAIGGGLIGLIGSILDSAESGKKKEERLKSLISQYQSNIPNN